MKFLIYNETDGVLAHPARVTEREAERIIASKMAQYKMQGFYSSVEGRIPPEAVVFTLVPAKRRRSRA